MILEYISNPNAIILAVTAANQVPPACSASDLIYEHCLEAFYDRIALPSFRDFFESVFVARSFLVRYAITSLRSRCSIAAQSLRSRCSIAAQSLRNRCSIAVQSLLNHCAIAVQSLHNRCAVAVQSLHNRCAVAVQSCNIVCNRCEFAANSLFNRYLLHNI
jgi:hypothetical protein